MFLETYRSEGARDHGADIDAAALALRVGWDRLCRWLGNFLRPTSPFGRAKEFRNVIRRRDARLM